MTSTIDELSRRKDEEDEATRRREAMTAIMKASNPHLKLAQHFNLDYGDVLLYADTYGGRSYENPEHEREAHARVTTSLGILDSDQFHTAVLALAERRRARPQ